MPAGIALLIAVPVSGTIEHASAASILWAEGAHGRAFEASDDDHFAFRCDGDVGRFAPSAVFSSECFHPLPSSVDVFGLLSFDDADVLMFVVISKLCVLLGVTLENEHGTTAQTANGQNASGGVFHFAFPPFRRFVSSRLNMQSPSKAYPCSLPWWWLRRMRASSSSAPSALVNCPQFSQLPCATVTSMSPPVMSPFQAVTNRHDLL